MFDMIFTLYESVVAAEPYVLILNGISLITMIVCVFFIVSHAQEHHIIKKLFAKFKANIKEQERLREAEYKKQFEMEGHFETKNRMQRLNRKLIDSGISVLHPEVTPEVFTIIVTLSCVLVGFFLQYTYHAFLTTLIGIIVTICAWVFLLELLITNNINQLEKETIRFVNLLKNVSHTENSLAEMLARTIPYTSNPLRTSIERCYYEIKTTGDTSMALQHLCDRTSYKKLNEVFEALRVCSTHNEDYESVINESNESVTAFISYRKEIKQIKQSNIIDILIMGGAGLLIIFEMKTMLTNIDVMYYLFETVIGQVMFIALILILAYSLYSVVKTDDK